MPDDRQRHKHLCRLLQQMLDDPEVVGSWQRFIEGLLLKVQQERTRNGEDSK